MKIIPLSEGSFTIDQSKTFVPFDPRYDNLHDRPKGSLLVEIQPFLVVTDRDVLLLDAGLGQTKNGVLQLFENLSLHGFSPSDITKVLMSHLHRDHAGGLTFKNAGDHQHHLSFPNALHFVHKDEFDMALRGGASFQPEGLPVLAASENLRLLDADGLIDGYIYHSLSGGHAAFHQVFKITEGGETCFFGGDEAPQLRQMRTKFIAKYDYDGKKAMKLRQQWWEQGEKEGWTFLFYHDISEPTYTNRKFPD